MGRGCETGIRAWHLQKSTFQKFWASPNWRYSHVLILSTSEVPVWLKSLRLHKYTPMFQAMSYAEMMALNDSQLEQRQVTKGARRKILQSLEKLQERVSLLLQLETVRDW